MAKITIGPLTLHSLFGLSGHCMRITEVTTDQAYGVVRLKADCYVHCCTYPYGANMDLTRDDLLDILRRSTGGIE